MTRAAAYTRVSTDEQVDRGFSLGAQLDAIRSFARAQGLDLPGECEYSDPGISGATDQRQGLQQMLADAEASRFDVVLVWRLDRLARGTLLTLQTLKRLEAAGCGLRSVTEPIDSTTIAGQMSLQFLAAVGEAERATIAERSRLGRMARVRGGKHVPHANRPFGFRFDSQTAGYAVVPEEAEWVGRIFHWYAAGESPLSIAHRMNAAGIQTVKGARAGFDHRYVSELTTRELYTGRAWANRYFSESEKKRLGLRGKAQRPGEEWIALSVPRIVSDELFAACREQRKKNKRNAAEGRARPDYLLLGLVCCTVCGQKFVAETKTVPSGTYRYLQCGGMRHNGHIYRCRERRNIRADRLEEAVLDALRQLCRDPLHVRLYLQQQVAERQGGSGDAAEELRSAEGRLRGLVAKRSRAISLATDGVITREDLSTQLKLIGEDVERTEAKVRRLREIISQTPTESELEAASRELVAFARGLDSGDPGHQRAIIRRIVREVRVSGTNDVSLDLRVFPAQERVEELPAPDLRELPFFRDALEPPIP